MKILISWKLLEIIRQTYHNFPGDFLDALSALRDYQSTLEHSKDKIRDVIQDFISYADNTPWTVKMMCQESRIHHIIHFVQQLANMANEGLETTLYLRLGSYGLQGPLFEGRAIARESTYCEQIINLF